MPKSEFVEGEAPEIRAKNENQNAGSAESSAQNSSLSSSTASSPASLSSPSPESSALFRILADPIENERAQNLLERIPGFPRIVLPREQTLLDILIQSSGVEDIHQLRQIREVRLRVVAATVSLSRLEIYTPHIRTLYLDGSRLSSLREIGAGLQHLKVLHVSRCGLTNLDGTFGLTNLVELYAADNQITNVGPCVILENIKVINLDRNPISSMANITLLSLCPCLSKLSIRDTPVSRTPDYKIRLLNLMPNLKKLDGNTTDQEIIEIEEDSTSYKSLENDYKNENTDSCSIELSSLSEPSSEDSSNVSKQSDDQSDDKAQYIKRPATSLGISSKGKEIISVRRPLTAQPRINAEDNSVLPDMTLEASPSFLTSGGVMCGNIARALVKARRPNRPLKPSSTKPIDPWVIGPPSSKRKERKISKTTENYIEEEDEGNDDESSASSSDKEMLQSNIDHDIVLKEAKALLEQSLPAKPQETMPIVDLEFGVTGCVSLESTSTQDHEWKDSSKKALEVSEQWRKAFKLFRQQQKISGSPEDENSSFEEENPNVQ